MTFMLFTTRAALFCTMMAIILLDGQLTASKVFVVSAYFNILSLTLSQMFVRGIAEIAEALVAMKRLRMFLEYEEKEDNLPDAQTQLLLNNLGQKKAESDEKEKLIESETQLPANISLVMKNVSARWTSVEEMKEIAHKKQHKIHKNGANGKVDQKKDVERHLTLDNISIELKKGSLVGIVGNVGAGKSSLLQAILKELPIQSGSITIRGNSLSFTEQEAWVSWLLFDVHGQFVHQSIIYLQVFAGTVRQNIIFGQKMDKDKYDIVVKSCALIKDFEQLPFGDKTIIGERGSSLSGGQKARVSLARAVYREAGLYLLDDPLSAVDAHVGRHLFDQCIGRRGYLGKQKATRILVTHQVHFLKEADHIIIMKDVC